MRTCIIFRGENLRHKRGITSALECIDNWKESIFDILSCDVVFFTYQSPILEELKQKLQPIHVCTSGYNSQESNALATMDWMIDNQCKYDRFVLLRFDFMYRKRITEWPHWEKKGITLTSKDVHYPTYRFYHDFVFIIDKPWVTDFKTAFVAHGKPIRVCLHHIGRYLEEMTHVPLHLMFPDYYHKVPLLAIRPIEPRPNLNDDYVFEVVKDISPWNPSLQSTKTQMPQSKPNVSILQSKPSVSILQSKPCQNNKREEKKKRNIGSRRPNVIFKK